jgi:hypothetical protein
VPENNTLYVAGYNYYTTKYIKYHVYQSANCGVLTLIIPALSGSEGLLFFQFGMQLHGCDSVDGARSNRGDSAIEPITIEARRRLLKRHVAHGMLNISAQPCL